MKTTLFERICKEGIVDTKTYRYCYEGKNEDGKIVIKRIKVEYLDTTAALDQDNWEIIIK